MKFYLLLPLCVFSLVACDRPAARLQHGLPMPTQTFEHVERLPVAVSEVAIVVADSVKKTYVGDYTVALDERAKLYFSKKLEAQPVYVDQGRLVVSIERADVKYAEKESTHSVFKKIGVDHVNEYAMNLSVRLEHQDAFGRAIYGRQLNVNKVYNVSEHDSPVMREQKRFDAIETMFEILDPEVTRVIRGEMTL